LHHTNDDGVVVEFHLGTLDTDISHRPDVHIFAAYKANWNEIETDCRSLHKEGKVAILSERTV